MSKETSIELTYKQLLVSIKQQVKSAQSKTVLAVNSFLIMLYIGSTVQQPVGLNVNESKEISVQLLVALSTLSV